MSSDPTPRSDNKKKPTVLVLGDHMRDHFVYDMRLPKHEQPAPEWTPPLSQHGWQSTRGFEMRYCVGGAAAIHAMLEENNRYDVNGNTLTRTPVSPKGCLFILSKRSNDPVGEKNRHYLSVKHGSNAQIVPRSSTWRVRDRLLPSAEKMYVTDANIYDKYNSIRASYICLYDIRRGSNLHDDDMSGATSNLIKKGLDTWSSKIVCDPAQNTSIMLVRTHDPSRFSTLLETNPKEECITIIFVCPLAELRTGNVRGAGTWTDVWSHAYDYLRDNALNLLRSDDTGRRVKWKAHIIVPVYQDGALWFGPSQWPFASNTSYRDSFTAEGWPPIGRIFVLPGSQPRLYDFREPDPGVGPNTLFVFTLLQKILSGARVNEIDLSAVLQSAIRCALTRVRRFHDRGYCDLDELTWVRAIRDKFYIQYPREVWAAAESRLTDALLGSNDTADQLGGAYEITCSLPAGHNFGPPDGHVRKVFNVLQKRISQSYDDVLVASPEACAKIVPLTTSDRAIEKNKNCYQNYVADLAKSENLPDEKPYSEGKGKNLIDDFVKDQIENFELWQHASMQFGKLTIANPHDSGPILDLVQRMQEHVMRHRYLPPEKGKVFNFAIFGTPGSGKSTLAQEIQNAVDPMGEWFSRREYNLSQFAGKEQLIHAFEEVAAQGLGGKVPLVLWDEFDTVYEDKRGGWLSHFLMPMQDARYFERHEVKFLGTAVFVFIGGTFPNAAAFRRWASGRDDRAPTRGHQAGSQSTPESVLLKAPDFHSRLFMALNMPSIVYVHSEESDTGQPPVQVIRNPNNKWDPKSKEDYQKLARSVLLRWWLKELSKVNKKTRTKRIDHDILQILLNIPLRHGARSLERIVEACLVNKPDQLSRHHLPPYSFLEEHIETTHVVAGDDRKWRPDPLNPVQSILEKIEALWLKAAV